MWDPKITTPPGLYLLSYLFSQSDHLRHALGIESELSLLGCNLFALRAINALGVLLLVPLLRATYRIRNGEAPPNQVLFQHSAFNIALFPPLFFFSALYYTDIWSTLFVVLFYVQLVKAYHDNLRERDRFLRLVSVGLISLMFRQTNIFWVGVFPTGIALVKHIDRDHEAVKDSIHRGVEGFGDSLYSVAKTSWKMEVVYDPPVRNTGVDGMLHAAVRLVWTT